MFYFKLFASLHFHYLKEKIKEKCIRSYEYFINVEVLFPFK
jgi:hypothetical protein